MADYSDVVARILAKINELSMKRDGLAFNDYNARDSLDSEISRLRNLQANAYKFAGKPSELTAELTKADYKLSASTVPPVSVASPLDNMRDTVTTAMILSVMSYLTSLQPEIGPKMAELCGIIAELLDIEKNGESSKPTGLGLLLPSLTVTKTRREILLDRLAQLINWETGNALAAAFPALGLRMVTHSTPPLALTGGTPPLALPSPQVGVVNTAYDKLTSDVGGGQALFKDLLTNEFEYYKKFFGAVKKYNSTHRTYWEKLQKNLEDVKKLLEEIIILRDTTGIKPGLFTSRPGLESLATTYSRQFDSALTFCTMAILEVIKVQA